METVFEPTVPLSQMTLEQRQTQEIKGLSWKQPFAELMFHGKIETRVWNTDYRGWVLICATQKGFSIKDLWEMCPRAAMTKITKLPLAKMPQGKAIGVGYLHRTRYMLPDDIAQTYVGYKSGLICHEYKWVERIEPFDFKGQQRWSKLSVDIWNSIKFIPTKP